MEQGTGMLMAGPCWSVTLGMLAHRTTHTFLAMAVGIKTTRWQSKSHLEHTYPPVSGYFVVVVVVVVVFQLD
jgi:hypothetical protein